MSLIGIGGGGNGYSIGQMMSRMQARGALDGGVSPSGMKEKPDFSQLVSQLDTDSSGSLGTDGEIQSLADKIAEATGVSVDLTQFLSTYDSNEDGTLSEGEAVSALQANPPQGPPPALGGGSENSFEQERVSSADTNEDGVISADETAELVNIVNTATGSSWEAEDFVEKYDADGDGSFSTDEAVAAMEANRPEGPPPPPGSQVASIEEQIVSGLDSDGDGLVSGKEAEGLVDIINKATGSSLDAADVVSAYDSDQDGSLSTAEAIAAMEAYRPEEKNATTAAMETYRAMSAMGAHNPGGPLTMVMENAQASVNRII